MLPDIERTGDAPRLVPIDRDRYEDLKVLGEGGMGEVSLARDNDIGRSVAIKRVHRERLDPVTTARFVDEVRTIGRLEHPNIVPIHDVGVDERGNYFFVMKHVEGETLEAVIEKIAVRDPKYLAHYTFEHRVEVFLALLRALQYAHAHGIVHRDLKPANVMVGRYGEVVLMDWGIAKPAPRDRASTGSATTAAAIAPEDTEDRGPARLYSTRHATLIGTPAYMSPEQATGRNEDIDERSDVYSACVLFHELLTLRHYLADERTVGAMLVAVVERKIGMRELFLQGPGGGAPPAELGWFLVKGLRKAPTERYQTVGEMIDALQEIQEGKVPVECPLTFMKRITREMSRTVDRRPIVAILALAFSVGMIVYGCFSLVRTIVG